jgi:tRNA pseudouridine55 synthase
LARKGKQVELQPRKITVHNITVLRYAYPELELQIACSSGTYVRSLGRDLAVTLGTGAVMSALERTAIGSLRLENAIALSEVSAENVTGFLLAPRHAVSELPAVELTSDEIRRIGNGMSIDDRWHIRRSEVAAFGKSGRLVAILAPRGPKRLRPTRNFPNVDALN